jgi:hypothetical protein
MEFDTNKRNCGCSSPEEIILRFEGTGLSWLMLLGVLRCTFLSKYVRLAFRLSSYMAVILGWERI